MSHRFLLALALLFLGGSGMLRSAPFDRYTNPILARAVSAEGVKEVKQLTSDLLSDHDGALPNTTGALVVVKTNGGRFSKVLLSTARHKINDKESVPILLIERFVTYQDGEEQAVEAQGQNIYLYSGFHFNLDIGQVVPAAQGGDLRFVVDGEKKYAEPLGKARCYLVTKHLPEAAPKKLPRPEVGATFEPHYFNGTYKLHDDGRRSGKLTLKVGEDNEVTGVYYSDRDGRKYEVKGKIGTPVHGIEFTIQFPRSEQTFQGWLFTGDGKALTGFAQLEGRKTGFYALRLEEE